MQKCPRRKIEDSSKEVAQFQLQRLLAVYRNGHGRTGPLPIGGKVWGSSILGYSGRDIASALRSRTAAGGMCKICLVSPWLVLTPAIVQLRLPVRLAHPGAL